MKRFFGLIITISMAISCNESSYFDKEKGYYIIKVKKNNREESKFKNINNVMHYNGSPFTGEKEIYHEDKSDLIISIENYVMGIMTRRTNFDPATKKITGILSQDSGYEVHVHENGYYLRMKNGPIVDPSHNSILFSSVTNNEKVFTYSVSKNNNGLLSKIVANNCEIGFFENGLLSYVKMTFQQGFVESINYWKDDKNEWNKLIKTALYHNGQESGVLHEHYEKITEEELRRISQTYYNFGDWRKILYQKEAFPEQRAERKRKAEEAK